MGCYFLPQGIFHNPGIKPGSPALEAAALTSEPPGKPSRQTVCNKSALFQGCCKLDTHVCAELLSCMQHHRLYPTRILCPWGFSARMLEWVVISFSRGNFPIQGSNARLLHCRHILYHRATGEAKIGYALTDKRKSFKETYRNY